MAARSPGLESTTTCRSSITASISLTKVSASSRSNAVAIAHSASSTEAPP